MDVAALVEPREGQLQRVQVGNVVGVIGKVGLDVGKKVISTRRKLRELITYLGGKVIHPVFGLPGGVAKGIAPDDLRGFGRWPSSDEQKRALSLSGGRAFRWDSSARLLTLSDAAVRLDLDGVAKGG